MSEQCPVTGKECSFLSAIKEARLLQRSEDVLEESSAKSIFEKHYEGSLGDLQLEYCSAELCGLAFFGDVAITAMALSATEEEIQKATAGTREEK